MLWWIIGVLAAIWVLYDVWTQQRSMDGTHRIIWTICAVLFSVITAIVYFFLVKRK